MVNVQDLFFTWAGPDGYCFGTGKRILRHNLPCWFGDRVERMCGIKSLAIDDHGDGHLVYEDANGERHSHWANKARYHHLRDYMVNKGGETNCVTTFGPHSSFVALSTDGYMRGGVAETAKKAMDLDSGSMKQIALGKRDTFVLLRSDGRVVWDVVQEYPDLETILSKAIPGEVQFVAMNPYKSNEFFVGLTTEHRDEVYIKGSAICENDISNALQGSQIAVRTSHIPRLDTMCRL